MCIRFRFGAAWAALTVFLPAVLWAELVYVDIGTPDGNISIPVFIEHVRPSGQAEVAPPKNGGFRPPVVFSAPLPTGSGARALGLAGAFTAVADDATAASWNPAGLTQLENPEVSAVYRFSEREDLHESKTRDLETDRNSYHNDELNYASAVYPFLLNGNNAVVSMNYQEAYDFTQVFTAQFLGEGRQSVSTTTNQTLSKTTVNEVTDPALDVTVTTTTTTVMESQIDQLLKSSLLTDIDFRQQGSIDAFSPAFAVDLTPRLSVGAVVNFYTDGSGRGNPIESSLVADYAGTSENIAEIVDVLTSVANIKIEGVAFSGPSYNRSTNDISYDADTDQISDVETNSVNNIYAVEGRYQENNRTDQFYGFNATLGALWAASDRLTLGATVDLPWTGRGKQTKWIRHQATTFDSNQVVVAESTYNDRQERDVEYTFPLYWSLGGLWRWNDRFYTAMDVSCTYWSQFSYKAEGEDRINPLNGEPHSDSKLDDCWAVRCGSEYLCVLSWTEIPLRGGVFWEQRPAVGAPDEFWGVSFGSGISLGKEPGKLILDIAYTFERGENVMGDLLPGQSLSSDVNKHQVFVSAIWHF